MKTKVGTFSQFNMKSFELYECLHTERSSVLLLLLFLLKCFKYHNFNFDGRYMRIIMENKVFYKVMNASLT